MTVVAGIDCGTNSIRLLIADYEGGQMRELVRQMRIVRLGQGVDKTGKFHPEALERTFQAVEEYAELCREHQVEALRFIATSASRDASNREEFYAGVEQRLGVVPQVISGDEEASLSFAGAISSLAKVEKPVLVVDIGGGSTEFILGDKDILAQISTNMGSVRVTERFGDGEDLDEDAATKFINQLLDQAEDVVDFSKVRTLVGVAGTVTTITARALGLSQYEPEKIDGSELTVAEVFEACRWMVEAPQALKAAQGYMPAGRADVIGGGALIWREIIKRVQSRAGSQTIQTVLTCEHDILDGITAGVGEEIEAEEAALGNLSAYENKPRPVINLQFPAGFLRGFGFGVGMVALSWVLVQIPVILSFLALKNNAWVVPYSWSDATKLASRLWSWSFGEPFFIGGQYYTVWPLGLLAFWFALFWLCLRTMATRFPGGMWFSIPGSWLGCLIVFSASSGAISYWYMSVTCSILLLLACAWLSLSSRRGRKWARGLDSAPSLDISQSGRLLQKIPSWLLALPRALVALAGVALVYSLLLLAFSALWHRGAIADIVATLPGGVGSAIASLVTFLCFFPTASMWALTWASGGSFQIGTGTHFSPFEVTMGPLPALESFGLLPQGKVGFWPILLTIAVGVAAGFWWHYRAGRAQLRDQFWLAGVTAFTWIVLCALLVHLTNGALGSGRLAHLGAPVVKTTGLLTVTFLVPALVVFLLIHPQTRQQIRSWFGAAKQVKVSQLVSAPKRQERSLKEIQQISGSKPRKRQRNILPEPLPHADETTTSAVQLPEDITTASIETNRSKEEE